MPGTRIICNTCGEGFDPRNLDEVLYHETDHKPRVATGIIGKPVEPPEAQGRLSQRFLALVRSLKTDDGNRRAWRETLKECPRYDQMDKMAIMLGRLLDDYDTVFNALVSAETKLLHPLIPIAVELPPEARQELLAAIEKWKKDPLYIRITPCNVDIEALVEAVKDRLIRAGNAWNDDTDSAFPLEDHLGSVDLQDLIDHPPTSKE